MMKDKVFKLLVTLGMMLFFSLSALPLGKLRGYDVGAIVLLVTALMSIWGQPKGTFRLRRPDRWLLAAGLLYVVAGFAEVVLDQQPIRGYDHASRFLLTLPIFLVLLAYPPQAKHLFLSAAVGGLLLGSASLYTKIVLGIWAGSMGLLSIQYACISMVIAAISLAGIGYFYQCRRFVLCGLCLLGSLMGVVAVFLSTSRGSWPSILVMLGLMLWVYRHALKPQRIVVVVLLAFGLFAGLYYTPQTTVKFRIDQAFSDISRWEKADRHSSLGERFVMWDNAWTLGQQKWFMGWGAQGFVAEKQRLHAQGELSATVARYGHPHNELLNAWLKRGLPGALAVLLLYLVPIVTFARYLRQTQTVAIRSVALASISVPVCFMMAGLTQTLLAHNSGVMFYIMALVLCWGVLRGAVCGHTTATASGR
ncbi:MAG: O-antigen ligase family protein [Neisseriaceae bacterium]|nr:O-antigen ligase family protein [Neisseriaceae bacterium]